MEHYYDFKKQDATQQEKHWTETLQFNEEFMKFKLPFMKMMKKHESMWVRHLGWIMVAKHSIVLNIPDAPPVHSAPHRAGPKQRELGRKEINNIQETGVAEPAVTEWISPVVFVPNKYESLRFCANYPRLYAVTVRNIYPIPRMDKCVESLGEAKMSSPLNANSGY